jgi:hypothetical protein
MAETVIIRFKGEDEVSPVADKVAGSVDNVASSAKSAGKGFSALGEIGIGALRGIGELALEFGKSAFTGAVDFFKSSVQGAAEYQSALAQTEAVLRSTGGAVGVTSQELETLARNLSAVSGQSLFTDDQILSAQNVLLTFTNIKEFEFADATAAIVDLSQAMGQDLQSSAVQVGKALNDPAEGITALTRVGVSFTEQQKEQVKALVETGKMAEAQRIILSELERQFGGSGAAAAQTFAGQMVVMQEKIEDAKGAIGDALLPLLSEMTTVFSSQVLPIIQDVTARIGAFFQRISDSGGVMASLDGVKQSIMRFVESQPVLQKLIELGKQVWATLTSLFADVTELASDPAVQNWLGQVASVLEVVFIAAIDATILALRGLGIAFSYIVDGIKIFAEAMTPIFNYVYPKMAAIFTALSQLLTGDFAGAFTTVRTIITTVFSDIYAVVSRILTDINTRLRNFINDVLTSAINLGRSIVGGIAQGIAQAKAAVEKALRDVIDAAINRIKDMLGIRSATSKLMSDAISAPLTQGLAAGLASGVPLVERSAAMARTAAVESSNVQNFYLNANYQTTQSQSSITTDLRAMQLLAGGVA